MASDHDRTEHPLSDGGGSLVCGRRLHNWGRTDVNCHRARSSPSRPLMLDAWDDFAQRWIIHHDDLLEAVVLLGEMLGVDGEDG